jgi:serine/threonine-protein kinase
METLRNKGFNKVTLVQVPCKMLQGGQPTCNNPDDVGKALSTDPTSGTSVSTTTEIKLSVGVKPGQVTVPNLTGKTQQEAQQALTAAGLYLDQNVQVTDVSDPNQYGKVVTQSAGANQTVDEGTTVTITVGKTPNMVQVTDYTGKQVAEAEAGLKAAGFKVSKQTQASDQPAGTVVNQKPNAGQQPEGSTVTLYVSDGSLQQISMPPLTGMTQQQAQAALAAAGWDGQLNYQADKVNDPTKQGLVTRTAPTAGTQISKNQPITLFIGETSGNGSSTSSTPTSTSKGGIIGNG